MEVNMKHYICRFSFSLLCGVFFFHILTFSASAEQWDFQLAPYAWLAGQNGTVATLPGLPPADVDVDFYEDISGNINLAGMLVAEARKGRFGLFTDIVYTDIEMEDPTPYGVLYSAVDTQTKSWMVSFAGLYRLVDHQNRFLDAIAGVRYWSVDTDLTLKAGLLPERSVSNSEDWFDPLIGLKGMSALGNSKFFINGGIGIGGFGVNAGSLTRDPTFFGTRPSTWGTSGPRVSLLLWATVMWMWIMKKMTFCTMLSRTVLRWDYPGGFNRMCCFEQISECEVRIKEGGSK